MNKIFQNKTFFCYLAVLFLMELFFFRGALSSKSAMIGDNGDARLNVLIMEHWHNVFQGKESVGNLSEFYPASNTISYTDMLLGYSIPYSFLRAIGINRFMACKIVLLCLHIFGTYCLFFLLYKIFETTKYAAFLGTIAFSFANGYALRMGHTQMMTLSLVPLLLIFISLAIKYYDSNKMRRIFLVLFASLYALIAYTGFYTFMFTTVFFMLVIVFEVIGVAIYDKDNLVFLCKKFKEKIFDWIFAAILFMVLLIPFINIYLPSLKMFGPRSWENVRIMSPQLIDIINVGGSNLLLGHFISKLNIGSTRTRWEWEMVEGFSVVLLLLLFILCIKLFKEHFRKNILREEISISDNILHVFAITSIFSVFLVIESGGYSLWYFIWKFVPGASAIRAISRWYYFLVLPLGILLGLLSNKYLKFEKISNAKKIMLMTFFAFALWISNVNRSTGCGWNYREELDFLKTIPTPPEAAKIMSLAPCENYPRNKSLPYINLDSWMIADAFGLKTVNGYSGCFPLNWNVWDIFANDYFKQLRNWIAANNIKDDVWLYNAENKTWKKFSDYFEQHCMIKSPSEIIISKKEGFHSGYELKTDSFISAEGENWLFFGPYKEIVAGKYKIEFFYEYIGDLPNGTKLGTADVNSNKNSQFLVGGSAPLYAGKNSVVLENVEIKKNIADFEMRIFTKAPGVVAQKIIIQNQTE